MTEFLARRKKTKTKRPIKFRTSDGKLVKFKGRRKPQRRVRVKFKRKGEGFFGSLFG